ncbi:4a-hydroxytetrahydrobiopterin dehydratase [bacterium]|nr:4a-hydroxytetrahydrobiopterin dehydratase [bacterium]
MATLLSPEVIQTKLSPLPDWRLSGQTITCTRTFKDFIAAVDFVNRLVEPAEAAGHHPDLSISYNRVTIALTTHDAGGLTEKDFALAEVIAQID